MAGSGNANMEQFEIYFQRADLDRDGRISGAEAVAFLQGSNLPKQVLAQIWSHADQNHTGYLSRPEFYNALKLVTVAQSKRELTPDIVKAALYGPASAKIPAPQINPVAIPASQQIPATTTSSPQIAAPALPSIQNFGFRGQAPANMSANQQFGIGPSALGLNQKMQYGTTPSSSVMRSQLNQIQPSSTGPNQPFGQAQQSTTATNWLAGQVQHSSVGMNQQLGQASPVTTMNSQFISAQGNQSVRLPVSMPTTAALRPSMGAGSPSIPGGGTSVAPNFPNSNTDWPGGKSNLVSSGIMAQGPNKDIPSINPVASNPLDQFSTISPTFAKDPKVSGASGSAYTSDSMFGGDIFSANHPSSQRVSSAQQQHMSVISSATVSPISGTLPSTKLDPFQALQSTITKPSSEVQASQSPLPKPYQQATIQVTSLSSPAAPVGLGSPASEQSQFSWPKMARASIQKYAKVFMEVDTDRDGRITGDQARNLFLSWRLPREVLKQVWDLSDQDGDSMLSLREFCISLYLMERYREGRQLPSSLPNSVMLDETLLSLAGPPINYGSMVGGPSSGLRPQELSGAQHVLASGVRPPARPFAQPDRSEQLNQQNTRSRQMDNAHGDQLSNGVDNSISNTTLDTNEKVENNEKVLLDSKEKLEFYRSKMQELVLYKSRCDNRLNEITERARADKAEAELLEKKYQEKYKEVAEIHSKLTIEEASFREIQERKTELQQAIIKIEQGGSADGILQVRADRIQSDMEELLKALNDRCKKHNIEIKSAAVIELPPGWMPGIPEVAAVWDEDWDKFEDEGLSFDVAVPESTKSAAEQRENSSPAPSFYPDSPSNAENASENAFSTMTSAFDSESVYRADESKSTHGSPRGQTAHDSPSEEYSDNHVSKSFDGDSEDQRRSFDEPSWGNFDTNDDVDSVWGFSAKDAGQGKSGENYFFGSNDFGASPRRTESPQADSSFKNSPFRFEESVPGSPLSKAGTSPPRYSVESRDHLFDSFSRYDSFSTHYHGSSPRRETRFDSISSTSGFDRSKKFSFDDSDPFGSSGPFKFSNGDSPKKGSEWSSF